MIISTTLAIVIAAAASQAEATPSPEELFCGEAMSIYLPEPKGTPAQNIKLANFQYMSPDDRCGLNVDNKELMRLHESIKPVAAAAFSSSKSGFAVMVRYTLTPDKPAAFDMQVSAEAADSEKERLTRFYKEACALKEFHSNRGTLYVVFHYIVSPSKAVASE